jgi:hypothetical protein
MPRLAHYEELVFTLRVLTKPIIRPTLSGKNKECSNITKGKAYGIILLYFVLCLTRNIFIVKIAPEEVIKYQR